MPPSFNNLTRQRAQILFGLALFAFAFGLATYRIHFGVDVFDEPFYAALAYRFAWGQKPFIAELNLAQSFALLTFPLVKFLLWLKHSTDGLILGLRWGYLLLYFALGTFLCRTFRPWIGLAAALTIAGSCIVFPPSNILTLSYNTLAIAFLTASLFMAADGLLNERGSWFLAGVFLALASIAYPTFSVMAGIYGIALMLFLRPRKKAVQYLLGLLLVFSPLALYLVGERSGVLATLAARASLGTESPNIKYLPSPPALFGLGAIVICGYAALMRLAPSLEKKLIRPAAMVILPLLPLPICHYLLHQGWDFYPALLGIWAPLPALWIEDRRFARTLLISVWLPSCLCGLIVSYTSTLGLARISVGMLPAALTTLVLLARSFIDSGTSAGLKIHWVQLAVLGLPVLLILKYPLAPYDDDGIAILTRQVSRGPFQGLWTQPDRANLVEKFQDEALPYLKGPGKLLVYDTFPVAYLTGGRAPAEGSVWVINEGEKAAIAALYRRDFHPGNRVLRMKFRYYVPQPAIPIHYAPDDPLNTLIETTHRRIYDSDLFTVFELSPTTQVKKNN